MKIKVIDLLNKIANGEQPNHIIFDTDDWYWGYDSYIPKNFLETSPDVQATVSLFKKYRIDYALNDEIEIIEEPKKIEKLDNIICNKGQIDEIITAPTNFDLMRKINEIIDYINKGDSNE